MFNITSRMGGGLVLAATSLLLLAGCPQAANLTGEGDLSAGVSDPSSDNSGIPAGRTTGGSANDGNLVDGGTGTAGSDSNPAHGASDSPGSGGGTGSGGGGSDGASGGNSGNGGGNGGSEGDDGGSESGDPLSDEELLFLLSIYNSPGAYHPKADINGDGVVDILDLSLLLELLSEKYN